MRLDVGTSVIFVIADKLLKHVDSDKLFLYSIWTNQNYSIESKP